MDSAKGHATADRKPTKDRRKASPKNYLRGIFFQKTNLKDAPYSWFLWKQHHESTDFDKIRARLFVLQRFHPLDPHLVSKLPLKRDYYRYFCFIFAASFHLHDFSCFFIQHFVFPEWNRMSANCSDLLAYSCLDSPSPPSKQSGNADQETISFIPRIAHVDCGPVGRCGPHLLSRFSCNEN